MSAKAPGPSTPSTVRALVAAELRTALPAPEWRVIDHDDSVDRIGPKETVLVVYRSRVAPVGFAQRRHELVVRLLVPALNADAADDALDPRLDDLLAAIDAHPLIEWTDAERGVFEDTWPAYAVTIATTTQKD